MSNEPTTTERGGYPADHSARLKALPNGHRSRQSFDEAKAALVMREPFFAHLLFDVCKLVPSWDLPTAATDGRTIWINPDFFAAHTPAQRVFILAHEISHIMWMHVHRMRQHQDSGGFVGPHSGKPRKWDAKYYNICADLIINSMLRESQVGNFKEGWLHSTDVTGLDQVELVYDKYYREQNSGQGKGPGSGDPKPGAANGESFDEHLPPQPGQPQPDADDVKQAVASAAVAAKSQGRLPAGLERFVKELLEPQVDWRTKLRHYVSRNAGDDDRSYARPNRRKVALPYKGLPIIMPGLVGHSAGKIAFFGDTSGSIGDNEMKAFMSEACAIVQDLQPELFLLGWCDAEVHRVDYYEEGATVEEVMASKPVGGGGTDFRPVFEWLAEHDIEPATLVFCTDLCGGFPDKAPPYPVIWCATTDQPAPFGTVIRINVA